MNTEYLSSVFNTGGSSPDAVNTDEVTVVLIADADKLVPSSEEWPSVRHSTQLLKNPFVKPEVLVG